MAQSTSPLPTPDFRALFEAVPGLYLVLLPDTPLFTILAVSEAYLRATMTERDAILGRGLFEVFPDNPDDPTATGVSNLNTSLHNVLRQRVPHTMAIQKYDIRRPESEGGGFEVRYWSPVNSPVFGESGEVTYILHRVEDVTEFVRLEEQRKEERQQAQESQARAEQRVADSLLQAEGLQEANSQLRQIIAARQKAEEELQRAHEFLDRVLDSAILGVGVLDLDGRFTLANPGLAAMLGYSVEGILGKSFAQYLPPDELPRVTELFYQTIQAGQPVQDAETHLLRKDTSLLTVSFCCSPLTAEGEIGGLVLTAQDITERKRLENQLLQAQKLESVGRLAGGIAHDFNNLLTAIMGYSELAEMDCAEETVCGHLRNVQQAAERAATLTRQLLAFARRQIIEPDIVNLNTLVRSVEPLLRRLITENIQLIVVSEEGLHSVKVDPGQFGQILVNLVVNARDAMPDGGKVTIETHNVFLDEEYAEHHEGVTPGEYVMLVVSDTGYGMDEAIRLHIFEPFYTTKAQGRGTGLGLATVYGIVKQAGGHIWLYSEPGKGTTFKIYLPRTTETPEARPAPQQSVATIRGSETLLLVEDEAVVRRLAVWALRGQGYVVLEAESGEEALRVAQEHPGEITLLVTDVVMPQMSGKELAERLQTQRPGIKVLYSSGYTEDTIMHHGVLDPGIAFLPKPFTPSVLARRVREVLDSRPGS
jgi:two-component system, cell cycle sensor histidine kinase and response regulator CckA